MIGPGFETIDPRTLTRFVVIEGAVETGGRGFTVEYHCPVGAAPAILEHVHTTWTERFEIVAGEAAMRQGGEELTARTGETLETPPGVPHIHPWNIGDVPLVYRQVTDFHGVDAEAVDDVFGAFATIHGLGREGRLDARGLPRNPFQAAATLRTLVRHGGYDATVPIPVQKVVAATLGRFAGLIGYRGVRRRFVTRY